MKKLQPIILSLGLSCLNATAQNQTGIDPLGKSSEMKKVEEFFRNDAFERPYTSTEIQSFVDFIEKNPIVNDNATDENISYRKIKVAEDFYQHTKDPAAKKKLVDLLTKTLLDIQVARDKLGINLMSESDGWLYPVPRPFPGEDTQVWGNRISAEANKRSNSIYNLESFYTHIYKLLTEDMKIKLEGTPKVLDLSPDVKKRTIEMLEKQAAAEGRKKPDPKAPTVEGK